MYNTGMSNLTRLSLVLAAVGCAFFGCETVDRARDAQEGVARATNDVAVAASTNALRHVDLKDCDLYGYVAFAMTNRPSLEASRLAVSNAVLALKAVTADRELQVNLSGGYSQSSLNTGSHFSWRQKRGKGTADIALDILICDWGRIDARELEARENLVAAQRDLADEEFAVFNEVAQAYFGVLRNDALLEVACTNEHVYAEHLKESETLYSAGEAKKLDVLKARVDLSDARLATINASNDVTTASAEFLRSLGLEVDAATREDVLAVAENAFETAHRNLTETRYDATEGLQLARTNAPALMVLRAELRASSARVDYAVADLLPELRLSSAFSFADPTWNWSWGFKAVQTILDGFRKETAIDRAVVDMETARTAVEVAEQKLSYDLAVATANRDNARKAFDTATVAVRQARENLETVAAQYRVGDASRLDFTDAVNTLTSALGTRVKTFYASEVAEAELIRLTGHVPPYANRKVGTLREVNDHEMD